MNELELTGRATAHLVDLEIDPGGRNCRLHRSAAGALLDLRAAAAQEGIDLVAVSAFRTFAAQVCVWNDKFHGRRTVYDRAGHPLDPTALDEGRRIEAILHWSALPGASRHHWGSDIDVIDRAALAAGASARLLPQEYAPEGPFGRLSQWLERNMQAFGFFRPYRRDRGGVAPEPWHLSYAPVALPALGQLTEEVLRRAVEDSDIAGRAQVLERLAEIYRRYVVNVDAP